MTGTKGGTAAYLAAMSELSEAIIDARVLATLLTYFAAQLNGEPQDLDGPSIADYPTSGRVLRALRRLSESRLRVEREWDWLSGEAREALPSPDSLEDGAGG